MGGSHGALTALASSLSLCVHVSALQDSKGRFDPKPVRRAWRRVMSFNARAPLCPGPRPSGFVRPWHKAGYLGRCLTCPAFPPLLLLRQVTVTLYSAKGGSAAGAERTVGTVRGSCLLLASPPAHAAT